MADLFGSIGRSIGGFAWSSLGNILTVIIIVLAVIIFFAVIFVFMWWKSFNIRVKIYKPVGQIPFNPDEIHQEELSQKLKDNKVRFDYIHFRRTHGKYATIKGCQYFITFLPMRKVPPIPMTLLYDDGVHLVQLSRDILVPIPKPKITLEVDENVNIAVEEDTQWKVWNNMIADRINNKYQDLDVQKRIAFYFISGIVAIVLLGGFLLWLIYRTSTEGYKVANRFSDVVQGLLGGEVPA